MCRAVRAPKAYVNQVPVRQNHLFGTYTIFIWRKGLVVHCTKKEMKMVLWDANRRAKPCIACKQQAEQAAALAIINGYKG